MNAKEITREQVLHVAALARIELSDAEIERMRADLGEMLAYVEKLEQIDTSAVPPTFQVGDPGVTVRADEVTNSPDPEQMLANAPARDGAYFKVPKIIE
jgi:aspartyl-tRNA(Asn)/glutamyl-tRNA(Gln) amidotransferase subunit C